MAATTAPAARDRKTRNFVFTINNPQDHWGSPEYLIESFIADGGKYIRFGDEIAPSTGTMHWQGFCEYKNQRFKKGISTSTFEKTAWLQERYGNVDSNLVYTGKEAIDGIHEWGKRPGQGAREDWEEIKKSIKAGKSFKDIAEDNTYLAGTCGNGIKGLIEIWQPAKPVKRFVKWNWGVTRSGKTYEGIKEGGVKISMTPAGQWQNYKGEKVAIINELDKYDKVNWRTILEMLDNDAYQLECRNVNQAWNAEKIYITSILNPKDVVPALLQEELFARVDVVQEFKTSFNGAAKVTQWI